MIASWGGCGRDRLDGGAGEARFRLEKGFGQTHLDGDGLADSTILMRLVSALAADDFILASG